MLRGSFAKGLVEGLAKSSARGIQGAMDDLDNRLSRLSDKRINKMTTELPRYKKELAENDEQIKMLAGLLNVNGDSRGMEIMHSLIVNDGWEKAKVLVPQIHTKLVRNGLKAGDYLGLSYTDQKGDRVMPTSKSLANLVTMPLNVPSGEVDQEALKGSGFSLLNFITRGTNNVEKYASKRMAGDLAFAGYSKKDLEPKFQALPTAGKVTINQFDLELGKSYASDLQLINAKVDSLQQQNNPQDKAEINRLKKLSAKTSQIISNLGVKEFTTTTRKSNFNQIVDLTSDAFDVEMTLLPSGQWQTVRGAKEAGNTAVALGNQITDELAWAHKGGRADTTSANLGSTARGFLPNELKDKLKNSDMLKFNNFAYEPTTFATIAASNGYKLKRVTKDDIINNNALDLNNGQPYLTIGDKVNIKNIPRTSKKTDIKNDSSITQDDDQITFDTYAEEWKTFTKNRASQNRFGVLARKIANTLLASGVSYTEAELKDEFKTITGSGWIPFYGDITNPNAK